MLIKKSKFKFIKFIFLSAIVMQALSFPAFSYAQKEELSTPVVNSEAENTEEKEALNLKEQKEMFVKDSTTIAKVAEEGSLTSASNGSTTTEQNTATKSDKMNKAETDIPVNLESSKKQTVSGDIQSKLIISILLISIILVGAYFFIQKIKQQGKSRELMPKIKILTQHYIGSKKSLAIIRVAGESILIGITDQNISHIKTLSLLDEEIPESTPQNFNDMMPKNIFKKESVDFKEKNNEVSEEEFSFAGITNTVSAKLKNMRTLG